MTAKNTEQRLYLIIGGPADGKWIEVGSVSNLVVPTRRGGSFTYTKRVISTPDAKVFYFAPEGWTDSQALQHHFEKKP